MQNVEGLTQRCRTYIAGIRSQCRSEPLPEASPPVAIAYVK